MIDRHAHCLGELSEWVGDKADALSPLQPLPGIHDIGIIYRQAQDIIDAGALEVLQASDIARNVGGAAGGGKRAGKCECDHASTIE